MKIINKLIDCCECCPAYKPISASSSGCSMSNGRTIKDDSIIQDWCPLDDFGSNIPPRQDALKDRRI